MVRHYTRPQLKETIRQAAVKTARTLATLLPKIYAKVDEFHVGGREATRPWPPGYRDRLEEFVETAKL